MAPATDHPDVPPETAAGASPAAMVLRDDALPKKPDLAGDWPAESPAPQDEDVAVTRGTVSVYML